MFVGAVVYAVTHSQIQTVHFHIQQFLNILVYTFNYMVLAQNQPPLIKEPSGFSSAAFNQELKERLL